MILERVVAVGLKMRRNAYERAIFNPLVGIADVFRHERKEQFLLCLRAILVGKRAGKQIEQIKTRALASIGNRHVLGRDIPTVGRRKIRSHRLDECSSSLRRIVPADKVIKFSTVCKNPLHLGTVHICNLGNLRRVSAAKLI